MYIRTHTLSHGWYGIELEMFAVIGDIISLPFVANTTTSTAEHDAAKNYISKMCNIFLRIKTICTYSMVIIMEQIYYIHILRGSVLFRVCVFVNALQKAQNCTHKCAFHALFKFYTLGRYVYSNSNITVVAPFIVHELHECNIQVEIHTLTIDHIRLEVFQLMTFSVSCFSIIIVYLLLLFSSRCLIVIFMSSNIWIHANNSIRCHRWWNEFQIELKQGQFVYLNFFHKSNQCLSWAQVSLIHSQPLYKRNFFSVFVDFCCILEWNPFLIQNTIKYRGGRKGNTPDGPTTWKIKWISNSVSALILTHIMPADSHAWAVVAEINSLTQKSLWVHTKNNESNDRIGLGGIWRTPDTLAGIRTANFTEIHQKEVNKHRKTFHCSRPFVVSYGCCRTSRPFQRDITALPFFTQCGNKMLLSWPQGDSGAQSGTLCMETNFVLPKLLCLTRHIHHTAFAAVFDFIFHDSLPSYI